MVNPLEDFTTNHQWIDVFGETIITLLQGEMVIGQTSQDTFACLLLFSDGIALT
jgi:hypothetical protein